MFNACKPCRLMCSALVLVWGVAATPVTASPLSAYTWAEDSTVEVSYSNEVRQALLAHYSSWAGTRHKLGGTGHGGVDCSSFIQTLFQDKFNIDLPRSSREQMTLGERVEVSELKSGDLLFFRTGPTRRHVGVYLGDNQFMHVSTRAGVQIAKLLSPYWQRHFITARRVGVPAVTPSN